MRLSTGTFHSASNVTDYEYRSAKFILVFFKLLGLAPLILVRGVLPKHIMKKKLSKTTATIQFAYSSLGTLYNVFLIVCLIGINFHSIPIVYNADYFFKSKLTVAIELVESITGNLTVLFVWLSFCIKQTTSVMIMNRLHKVDRAIGDLTGDREESNRSSFLLILIANFLLRITVVVTNQLCFATPFLGWFNSIVPCTIVNWLTIQYVMMIKLVEIHFRRLNRCLLSNSRSLIVQPIRSLILESRSMDNHYSFPKIMAFRRAHISLYEIANDVADFYSLPIVLAIAFSCYSIVYNSYYAVLPIVVKIETNGAFIAISSVIWLISMGVPIITLSANVEGINDQMHKTADAVHKLLTRELTSREEKFELEEFSRELLHRKVEFDAYGLFPLDYTLVQSICSMVAMYLIILLQFQMAASKSDTKITSANVTNAELHSS